MKSNGHGAVKPLPSFTKSCFIVWAVLTIMSAAIGLTAAVGVRTYEWLMALGRGLL